MCGFSTLQRTAVNSIKDPTFEQGRLENPILKYKRNSTSFPTVSNDSAAWQAEVISEHTAQFLSLRNGEFETNEKLFHKMVFTSKSHRDRYYCFHRKFFTQKRNKTCNLLLKYKCFSPQNTKGFLV